ncbi:glycerate kinase type-2 family protein [Grimontia sp. NTOU-MAR1]|uniref:glycerate kinase type-2 family protein n=1 Tax=Grimontia sp. NTOU-MAR1 TaxID=3111011 RepID=UPI002DB6C76A|nr:glycerate kinase [Grimontia sp. NTOU-MAR1]WRW00127.1 glycerate kinase [Grimontia sp. NTOU-MAR1]
MEQQELFKEGEETQRKHSESDKAAVGGVSPPIFLRKLFDAAVDAALPYGNIEKYLPADRTGNLVVIGAGKAAASMAKALEDEWDGPISGIVVTRYLHGAPCKHIEVMEASHPVPDGEGEKVARLILNLVTNLDENDTVICLLSGGGSALLSLPAPGINFSEKQDINKALLKSGAAINEINCVRKHLSAVKGGKLAQAAYPASILTLAISDVPGDASDVIASGPTVADPTTRFDAIKVLNKYDIPVSGDVITWLESEASETPKAGDERLSKSRFEIISTPFESLVAAQTISESLGIPAYILGDALEGESRDVALVHAAMAISTAKHDQPFPAPCVILSGGETTVTVKGNGRGGRNCEFLLSLYQALEKEPDVRSRIYALAGDTDGIDGVEDNAGAELKPEFYSAAAKKGISSARYLANNDSYGFYEAVSGLIFTGPTRTNVNDFRAILILPE